MLRMTILLPLAAPEPPPLAPLPTAPPPPPPPPPAPREEAVFVPPPAPQYQRIQDDLAGIGAEVEPLGDFIAIRLGEELQFGSGGATLGTDITPIIAPIAAALNAEPGAIIVEGHSDNIPLSGFGRFRTNEALSEARAQAVADVLTPMLDDPSRVSVVGIGPARPLSFENTPAARNLNRRVEILLTREQR